MNDMFDLAGRVAVVTGGAGVLGTQFAHALAERGAGVVIADIEQNRCDECATDVAAAHNTDAVGVETDVSRPADVARLVEHTTSQFNRIDILINNAAVQPPGFVAPFEEYSLDLWNRVMAVNLTGMFLVAQAVGRTMLEQGRGSIINISSVYGVVAPDHRVYDGSEFNTPAVYSVSKAGVLGLTRYLAAYWAEKGVRVNAVTPGGVFRNHKDPFLSLYTARVPMGRMARQDELAGAVVYLASDASSYVTGQNIVVDGGLTVW